jgi:hypothetical protein
VPRTYEPPNPALVVCETNWLPGSWSWWIGFSLLVRSTIQLPAPWVGLPELLAPYWCISLLAKNLCCRTPVDDISHFLCFLYISSGPYYSHKDRWSKQSPWARHHTSELHRSAYIHTTGSCPVSQKDSLRHWYHHFIAMQPSARHVTPWLQFTRALSLS